MFNDRHTQGALHKTKFFGSGRKGIKNTSVSRASKKSKNKSYSIFNLWNKK